MIQSETSRQLGVVRILYYLAVLTISFEVFLVIPLGFMVKTPHILLAGVVILSCYLAIKRDRIIPPLGIASLLLWSCFIVAFTPNTTFLIRNIGYSLWLIFSILLVVATVQLFDNINRANSLLRWYLFSFGFVGAFGIIQFVFAVSGIGVLLVRQWWVAGYIPRVNGFSYEPSFYATYLLPGWIFTAYLLEHRSTLLSIRRLSILLTILTIALILSSSRMGIAMMALYVLKFPAQVAMRLVRGRINIRYAALTIIPALGIISMTALLAKVPLLLLGTGLLGSPSHSTLGRFDTMADTFQTFLKSPIIGYSLGGIPSARGQAMGISIGNFEDAKRLEGMCTTVEVLAASGLIGFAPYVVYIATLLLRPLALAKNFRDSLRHHALKGLVISFAASLLLLQFNQNILRLYFWMHIGILCAVYHSYSRSTDPQSPAKLPTFY